MKSWFVARALVGIAVTVPGVAFAQAAWIPASEVLGQPIQTTTNGITNTVTLSPGGQAAITTPGGRVVPATWTAANGQLCLSTGAAQECWPYATPFQAGQPVTLSSSCNSSTTWLAQNINQAPAPMQRGRGERGR